MNLPEIAADLHRRVAAGKPAEVELGEFKLILRPVPEGKIQLATVGWCRHWPRDRRPELLAAFGAPEGTLPHAQIVKGWQILKWTWPRPEAKQLGLFPGQPAGPNHYQEG